MRIQKRINHTNRKKIGADRVSISITENGAKFEANLNLVGLGLPNDAPVYVEPYFKHSYMRFPFGTVQEPTPPSYLDLSEVDAGGGVLFRVKVVEEQGEVGKLLALANRISPTTPEDNDDDSKESLLHVREKDLGEEIWKLERDSGDRLELVINNKIPGASNQIRHSPIFQALILPQVLRETLLEVLERCGEDEDEPGAWETKWLRFGEILAGDPPPANNEEEDWERWVNDAVEAFSKQHRLCTKLVEKLAGGQS